MLIALAIFSILGIIVSLLGIINNFGDRENFDYFCYFSIVLGVFIWTLVFSLMEIFK